MKPCHYITKKINNEHLAGENRDCEKKMNKTRKLASVVPCFVGNTVTLNIFIFNKRYLIKDIS